MKGGQEGKLKVFIVDDSALVRERLAALLSELETVELVGQAGDGHEALEAIGQLRPNIVILDIHLPEGNGIRLLKALKKDADAPVVIVLSALPYPQYRQKCLQLGAEYFFDKVTEFEDIVTVLERMQNDPHGQNQHPASG